MQHIRRLTRFLSVFVGRIYSRFRARVSAAHSPHSEFTPRLREPVREQLTKFLQDSTYPSFWFLSWTTWFSNAFQRPQQLALALAELGHAVVYYEPWEFEPTFVATSLAKCRDFVGLREIQPKLGLLRCPRTELPYFITTAQPQVALLTWPREADLISSAVRSLVVYEMVDHHDLMGEGTMALKDLHLKWVRQADVMLVTADALLEEVRPYRSDVIVLPNGVSPHHWRPRAMPVPRDLAPAREAAAIIGYFGAVAPWFDWNLWTYAARRHPEWSFVLVGLPYQVSSTEIASYAESSPNIHFLGPKPYADLPSYALHFDVATIPFMLNAITHACSPVKLFEYLAMGKPIVATAMREVVKYPWVQTAATPPEFVAALERAVATKDDPREVCARIELAQAHTWRSRATVLRDAIRRASSLQNHIPRRAIASQNGLENVGRSFSGR